MNAIALLVGIVLVGQSATGDDRYPVDASAEPAGEVRDEPSGSDDANRMDETPSQPPLDDSLFDDSLFGDDSPGSDGAAESAPTSSDDQFLDGRTEPPPPGDDRSEPSDPVDVPAAAPRPKPSALMRSLLRPPTGSELSGVSVTLAEVVADAASRDDGSRRIDAYWELSTSVAEYYVGLRELEELRRVRDVLSGAGSSPEWHQAEAEFDARAETARVAAVASQYRLSGLIYRGGLSRLPLPADAPHCGDYRARYEQIFAGRPHAEAEELAALLPARYEELKQAAAAVRRAEQSLETARSQLDIEPNEAEILQALETVALQRRAFLRLVHDYNRRIARYAELAAPGEIDPDRLVSMLISHRSPDEGAAGSSASAPPANRQSRASADAAPPTFVENGSGWVPARGQRPPASTRDEAVQQAAGQSPSPPARQERSLLVNPR